MGDHLTGVAILGSTGSIGTQSLDVLIGLRDRFRVVGLAAGRNLSLLNEQIQTWQPVLISCERDSDRDAVVTGGAAWATPEEIAAHPDVEVVLVGTAGKAGLGPTLAALEAGKAVALANKEVLVMAGGLVRAAAEAGGGSLRPVDSEHSAIWQCLWGEQPSHISKLILTASGGAFRDRGPEELRAVRPEEALRHPTWNMGRKITIDCATLLNKGLEAIEAHWLFDIPMERVDVLMHRESIVHSLVEFADGSVKAQLGLPDMRLPIQCSFTYPERLPVHGTKPLDLATVGSLHFAAPDYTRLPCLGIALEAGRRGGTYPAAMAAADEVAVELFLSGGIGFMDIATIVEATLDAHTSRPDSDVETILEADRWARAHANAVATSVSSTAGSAAAAPVL